MSDTLQSCPFCGSTEIDPEGWTSLEQYKGTEVYRSGPACDECGASAETVARWNMQTAPALLERVKELEAENIKFRELLSWLNRKGGLGHSTHDTIRAALAEKDAR